jgi:hypothetical protein
MIEILVGAVLCFSISLGVRFYLRFFATKGARHPEFEQWCRSRPVLLAVRCGGDGTREIVDALRELLAPGEFFNSSGRYPWQHYILVVEHRRLADDVVGVVVTGCKLERARHRRPDIRTVVEGLGSRRRHIEELWLHGQLHVETRASRERGRMGWLGSWGEDGTLGFTAMIGSPPWLGAGPTSLSA